MSPKEQQDANAHAPRGSTQQRSTAGSQRSTRRRGAELTQAIHEATAKELAENGFDAVTFDRVARRARMSKATIYGRYRSPGHLIIETLAANTEGLDFKSTGSLREDLLNIIASATSALNAIGIDVYRRLIGVPDAAVATLVQEGAVLTGHRFVAEAVEAAQSRGELGPRQIPTAALRTPIEILHSRTLVIEELDHLATEIVDDVALPLFHALSTTSEKQGAVRGVLQNPE